MATLDKARSGPEIVVRAQRNDHDVRGVCVLVRHHAAGVGIDCCDQLLLKLDPGLCDVRVVRADLLPALLPEHDLELRKAEDKSVALVDEGDVHLRPESGREPSRQLKAAEAGAADDDVWVHAASILGT